MIATVRIQHESYGGFLVQRHSLISLEGDLHPAWRGQSQYIQCFSKSVLNKEVSHTRNRSTSYADFRIGHAE